jgi:hypothetical protein
LKDGQTMNREEHADEQVIAMLKEHEAGMKADESTCSASELLKLEGA